MPTKYTTLALLLTLLLCACSEQDKKVSEPTALATTLAPVASLLGELMGEDVRILTLLPEGGTPETYEPTAQDLMLLSSCQSYIYMGDLGFERQWISRIAELAPQLVLVNVGDSLATYIDRAEHERDVAHSHAHHHHHAHDPHYWTSIRGVQAILRASYAMAQQHLPVGVEVRAERYAQLMQATADIEAEVKQLLEQAPSRAFVIYHPSLTDFAEEFDLRQLVIEQDGKEPSVQQLASLIQEARQAGVRVVFTQKEFGTRLCQSVAEEIGAQLVEIDPLSGDWRGQIRLVAESLAK